MRCETLSQSPLGSPYRASDNPSSVVRTETGIPLFSGCRLVVGSPSCANSISKRLLGAGYHCAVQFRDSYPPASWEIRFHAPDLAYTPGSFFGPTYKWPLLPFSSHSRSGRLSVTPDEPKPVQGDLSKTQNTGLENWQNGPAHVEKTCGFLAVNLVTPRQEWPLSRAGAESLFSI